MRCPRLVVLLALTPLLARAETFNTFGYGPRATSMGGAMTAAANDFTAVFYNPALLVDRKEVNFGFQFQFYRMVSDVQSKDLAKDLDLSNADAPDVVGTSVGLLFPLGGKVKNHLALGLGVYLPTAVMVRLNSPSARTPYWYRYHASPERLQLHLGAGLKLTEWLKVGLGLQALADLIGTGANVSVDLFSKQINGGDINAYLGTRVGPVFSLAVSPLPRLRFGATFKWEMQLLYRIPAEVDLEGIGRLGFVLSGVAHYAPHTLNLGVAFDATKDLTFSLDGEYQAWSLAPTPYTGINIDLSGPTLEALGLGSALDVVSAEQKPGFKDTFGARFGAEYRVSERFAARLGGVFRPTPVPKQDTQGTNLLDNTTLGASVGVGFNFPDPLEVFQHPIQIDLAGQAQLILPREANKASTDSQPSYKYQASVYGVTAALRYDF